MNRPAGTSSVVATPRESPLDGVDPRVRIITAIVLAAAAVWASRWESLAVGLLAALACLLFSNIAAATAARRLAVLNAVFVAMTLVLALSGDPPRWNAAGPVSLSIDGLRIGIATAIKGNTVVLAAMALIGSMPPVTLGHAFDHLHVPAKLSHLFLFTVRYVEVLTDEYRRLRAAMKVRGFRARPDLHTYRSLGYLAGMMLIRALERSERIEDAMKCRGFRGRFYLLDHFALSRRDIPPALGTMICLGLMIALEYRLL